MKKLYNTIEQNLKKGLNVVVKDLRSNIIVYLAKTRGEIIDSGWE